MPKPSCGMNETKLEINENYEEAELSDVDDDVFVRSGGRNGYRLEYDNAKKPLMTPRKKSMSFGGGLKNGGLHTEVRSSPPIFHVICLPLCYIVIATLAMLGIIAVVIFLASHMNFAWPRLGMSKLWMHSKVLEKVLPCDKISVEDVWVRQFPKLLTESSFRTLDVNQDGFDDLIFGFATGADGLEVPDFVCDIYFGGQKPCFGGVLALDGRNGTELWRHWTAHEVFAINCNEDLNKDGIHDCLIAGRAGVFCTISGKDGALIWKFEDARAKDPQMNFYTPQFIRDLNGDGVLDLVTSHGGDPLADSNTKNRRIGRIIVVSGKTGEVLQWMKTPDDRETYYSPQIVTRGQDGSEYLLFGTGGETNGGGLYLILLSDLYKGLMSNAQVIYRDEFKGVMVPPVLTDVNGDGTDDIVMAMFNSTVIAFDGDNFHQIWNFTFPSSETYTTPTPGYFNIDDTPDFLVKYQTGPGFPIYYQAKTTVLDGKTGKPLLEAPILDSIGSQASTPLVRVEGIGNDIFLYWSSNCKGFEGNSTEFTFVKGTNVHEQSRSDFCKLRFGSKLVNQLRAFNRITGAGGQVIYDSEARSGEEYNNTINTSEEGQAYLRAHPQMWAYFDQTKQSSSGDKGQGSGGQGQDASYQSESQQNYKYKYDGLGGGGLLDGSYGSPNNAYGDIQMQVPLSLSSQPELTEDVKYPYFHAVRKHGKLVHGDSAASPVSALSPSHHQSQSRLTIPQQNIQNIQGIQNAPYGTNSNPNPNLNLGGGGGRRIYSTDGLSPVQIQQQQVPQQQQIPSEYYYGGNINPNGNYYDGGLAGLNPGQVPQQQQLPFFSSSKRGGDAGTIWGRENINSNDNNNNAASNLDSFLEWEAANAGQRRHNSRIKKRHVGPHDNDGIQRLISTGVLVAPLDKDKGGIDLVFGTYWFYPAKTQIIPKGRDCEDRKNGGDREGKYGSMDDDLQYDDRECGGGDELTPGGDVGGDDASDPSQSQQTYESQSSYNPFDIHMGQMTVYRLHISCSCSNGSTSTTDKDGKSTNAKTNNNHERCGKILPLKEQPWTGYMGSSADSYFKGLGPGNPILRFLNLV